MLFLEGYLHYVFFKIVFGLDLTSYIKSDGLVVPKDSPVSLLSQYKCNTLRITSACHYDRPFSVFFRGKNQVCTFPQQTSVTKPLPTSESTLDKASGAHAGHKSSS